MTNIKFNRRNFIKNVTAASSAMMLPSLISSCNSPNPTTGNQGSADLMKMKKPVAIAMWDYTWLLRHHKQGDFEDWDRVLDGLVERGYNAIRMDCFPQFIAADSKGKIQEEFFHIRETWKPSYWGNQFSMHSRPRDGLIEFLSKCEERKIYIGLASWFMPHGTERNMEFKSIGDFIRAWDETLTFINNNNLLENIIYVDLLNEYPLWHGFEWFKKEMNLRSNEKTFRENNPDANVPDEVFMKRKSDRFTPLQQEFYQNFIDRVITNLKEKWPDLVFFASQPGATSWTQIDYSKFGAIDPHFWFAHNGEFNSKTGVSGLNMFRSQKDRHFGESYAKVLAYWEENRQELTAWMEERIMKAAALGNKYSIPVGNTEGWGAVFWQDHPLTGWEFIKYAAEVSADLAVKHDYKFICTSNFTHPQFKGMWDDLKWHKQLTNQIKTGK